MGIQPSPMPNAVQYETVTINGEKYHTIMVTGSREFNDLRLMDKTLREYAESHAAKHPDVPLLLVSGHAQRGADVLAEMVWPDFGPLATEPANWKEHTPGRCRCAEDADYCKLAGIVRNELMVDKYQPSVVVAFYEPTAENRGTNHAAEYARDQGIPVRTVIAAPVIKEPAPLEIPNDSVENFVAGSL